MERDGEGKGSVAVRKGNFLHCSASGLLSDNQFMNMDPSVSFEVAEWKQLVRSSLKNKQSFNPWDNCKILDLGRNYQNYKEKSATSCLRSSFADYTLHVVQPCHTMVKKGDIVGQYTEILSVKLIKTSCSISLYWKDLQLGYSFHFG